MIPVGLLGKNGLVGQMYQKLIAAHPEYDLMFAPSREELHHVDQAKGAVLIFSALPGEISATIDPLYAQAGFPVFSAASCHRMEEDIPLVIPEVNPHHFDRISLQQAKRGWKGCIVSKPNCTLQGMVLPLFPLHSHFGLRKISVTYLQARSGAGKGFKLVDNVLPYIPGEEEKTVDETRKILDLPNLPIAVQSFRVPVPHGHLASVSAAFDRRPTCKQVREIWESFPSIHYHEKEMHPQPALDLGEGMEIQVGRLRSSEVMDIQFVSLSNNLIRGAAGGGILTADVWRKYAQKTLAV